MTEHMKDNLIDKLDEELSSRKRYMTDSESNTREIEEKTAIRNALYNTPLSEYALQALCGTEDILHEIYTAQGFDMVNPVSAYDAIHEYLEKAEKVFLCDKLYDRMNKEYQAFLDEVRQLPPDKIIDKAYEITIKQDIVSSFEYGDFFSNNRLKALMTLDDPLWSVYSDWMRNDFSHMDDIRATIENTADDRTIEIGTESFAADNDYGNDSENEDELEL